MKQGRLWYKFVRSLMRYNSRMTTPPSSPESRIEAAWRNAMDLPPPEGLGHVCRADDNAKRIRLPLYGCSVPAGFPSPADDHLRQVLSLDEHCIRRPAATFMAEVKGSSMVDANIHDGDVVIIDRSISPRHGHIVVAVLDGGLTVKRLALRHGRTYLEPANPRYQPIEIHDGQELQIWGVVVWTLHNSQTV